MLSGAILLPACPAFAADELKFGPPPVWVVPQPIPPAPTKATEAPVALLLRDEQIRLEPGKLTRFTQTALKIQKPEGLEAGNLSFSWDPARDTLTINKVQIRRGGEIIDVLASGQKFTTLRRESNLELAVLDGRLTATMQPEGLREGDIVELATTLEHVDPILKNHVEAGFGAWNQLPITLAHTAVQWPASMNLNIRESGGLQTVEPVVRGGRKMIEITGHDVQPLIPPKGAPPRFAIGRVGEATDFHSWAEAAELMAPLFRSAEAIPASGPLHDEVNKIRVASSEPKVRAEMALQLVQDRVRNVGLVMGDGGYKPAAAEETWSRRFGDCKAKTALLLGMLHSFDISAEPVLVSSRRGDAVADRLPTIGAFDHVLVRAHIAGKTFWLDGTRTGDQSLDDIEVPYFTWGLPLVAGAKLVSIVPPPLNRPKEDSQIVIDASKGARAPATFSAVQTLRGDQAIALNKMINSLSEAQRTEFFDTYWKQAYDFVTPGQTNVSFDVRTKTFRLSMRGNAKLDWNTGYFHVPGTTVGYSPNFDRAGGPLHDVPLDVAYPAYVHSQTTLRFPSGFFGGRRGGVTPTTSETLAGVEYRMSKRDFSDASADTIVIEASERSIAPEIPYNDGLTAASRLRELANEEVSVPLPPGYRPTPADLASMLTEQPTTTAGLLRRGVALLNGTKLDEAIADFTQVLKTDPKNIDALANRAISYVWKRDPAAAKDISAAMAIDATNAVLQRARGLLAEQKGDCGAAVDAYSLSLKKQPANPFALGHRAMCEKNLGKTDEALADSDLALKASPNWIELRLLRANIYHERGNREATLAEAHALLAGNPSETNSYVAAARIFAALAMTDQAMKAFDRAIAIKPEAYIYVNRAQSRRRSEMSGRLADLDSALKIDPENVEALAGKAQTLDQMGKPQDAIPLYDRAISKKPQDADLPVARAIALYHAGRTKEAQSALAALRIRAKTADELNNLCWEKATARIMLDSAVQECREAVKLAPNDGAIADSLGMALLQSGKFDEALAAYDTAIAKRTGANSLMGRAIVYARKGDRARADADAAAARKLYPEIDLLFADYGLKL